MALENFLWEFGCKDEEWLKPKKNNHEPCDGVVQQEDVDMLRNVQVTKIKCKYLTERSIRERCLKLLFSGPTRKYGCSTI